MVYLPRKLTCSMNVYRILLQSIFDYFYACVHLSIICTPYIHQYGNNNNTTVLPRPSDKRFTF